MHKTVAARANLRLGCLDESISSAIVDAAAELGTGRFDDHFPLTIWQTGSGTQTNMNANEVIANRANQILAEKNSSPDGPTPASVLGSKSPVHPNDHVNRSQSSNDSFPTVMHIVTLNELRGTLIPCLRELERLLGDKAVEFQSIIKIGRTHMMDAVPMTMGQSFDAFKRQVTHHIDRVQGTFDRLRELPQGGTAVGSGVNMPAGFDVLFCEELNKTMREDAAEDREALVDFVPAASKFESMGCHDAMVEVSGVLNGLATMLLKLATDMRLLGSGPRCGLAELIIPDDGLTSSIMPGKRNPTLAEMLSQITFQAVGSHTAVTMACAAGGHFELNVAKPVIIYNVLQTIKLLSEGTATFARGLIAGLQANKKTLEQNVSGSLLQATSLNPLIGYDRAARIVRLAMDEDLTPREAALKLGFVTAEEYDKATDPRQFLSDLPSLPQA